MAKEQINKTLKEKIKDFLAILWVFSPAWYVLSVIIYSFNEIIGVIFAIIVFIFWGAFPFIIGRDEKEQINKNNG